MNKLATLETFLIQVSSSICLAHPLWPGLPSGLSHWCCLWPLVVDSAAPFPENTWSIGAKLPITLTGLHIIIYCGSLMKWPWLPFPTTRLENHLRCPEYITQLKQVLPMKHFGWQPMPLLEIIPEIVSIFSLWVFSPLSKLLMVNLFIYLITH